MSIRPGNMSGEVYQVRPNTVAVVHQTSHNRTTTDRQRRQMKADRRKIFVTVLGIMQLIIGSLFFALGTWSVLKERAVLLSTFCAPFLLASLSFLSGYLAIFGPRNNKKKMILLLISVETFACFLSLALVAWMFVSVIKSSTPSIASYKSFLMGLNVLLMLDSGIIAASTWTLRETLIRRRRNRRSPNGDDPPPAYYPSRMMYFNEEFALPTTTIGAPPPYEP